jgi:hypothetical protein
MIPTINPRRASIVPKDRSLAARPSQRLSLDASAAPQGWPPLAAVEGNTARAKVSQKGNGF